MRWTVSLQQEIWSPAQHSGLRIPRCRRCGLDLIPGPGNSICHRAAKRRKKESGKRGKEEEGEKKIERNGHSLWFIYIHTTHYIYMSVNENLSRFAHPISWSLVTMALQENLNLLALFIILHPARPSPIYSPVSFSFFYFIEL